MFAKRIKTLKVQRLLLKHIYKKFFLFIFLVLSREKEDLRSRKLAGATCYNGRNNFTRSAKIFNVSEGTALFSRGRIRIFLLCSQLNYHNSQFRSILSKLHLLTGLIRGIYLPGCIDFPVSSWSTITSIVSMPLQGKTT